MIAESTACMEAALQGRLAFLDSSPEPARLRVFEAPRPADIDQAPEGECLCEIALTQPAGTVTNGALTLIAQGEGLILRTGIAAWVRVVNGQDVTAFDLDASEEVGTGEAKFTSVQLYAGGSLRLTSLVLG
jgi:hypothetical protein